MHIFRSLIGQLNVRRAARARRRFRAGFPGMVPAISGVDWSRRLTDPTSFYLSGCHFFDHHQPEPWRRHQEDYTQNRHGFGGGALRVRWCLRFREFKQPPFAGNLQIGYHRFSPQITL